VKEVLTSKKGLITLLMVFVMALGFVGCDDGDDDPSAFETLQKRITRYQGNVTDAQNVLNSADADYDALVAAIATAGETLTTIEELTNGGDITDEQLAEVTGDIATATANLDAVKADKEAIDNVIATIADLPTAGALTMADKAEVEAARAAYNALESEGKMAKVSNLATLTAAEAALAEAGAITNVADLAAVEIEVNGDVTAVLPGNVEVTYADASTAMLEIVWDTASFDNQAIGTVTVAGIVTNPNTAAEVAVEIDVTVTADTTAPVITLDGANPTYLTIGAVYVEAGATAVDTVDGDVDVTLPTTAGIDTTTDGSFTLTYSAIDAAGNEATATRTVIVDGTAPVITLTGDAMVTITLGAVYVDAGATTNETGVEAVPNGTVDENVAGTYTITYTAKDMAGNEATPVTRTVVVNAAAGNLVTMTGTNDGEFNFGLNPPYIYTLEFTVAEAVQKIMIYQEADGASKTLDTATAKTVTAENYTAAKTVTALIVEVYGADDELLDTVTLALPAAQ
jgi:hypothetical protein